ncbi:DUF2750 domain-containing protein [Alteromonas sp. NFXS44]|uniref:DUF2750 domain-containing protein n=1 Tax=Alteromonas sp. NFXS44 TaxID=2818435 RepID=UPI0032DEF1BF
MFPDTVSETLPEIVQSQAALLSPEERTALFLQYSTKAQSVWLVKGEEGFVMFENDGAVVLPVWPHKDLINTWEVAAHTTLTAEKVALDTFMETWLPGMAANNTHVCVFPLTSDDAGIIMTASELADSLQEETK